MYGKHFDDLTMIEESRITELAALTVIDAEDKAAAIEKARQR